MSHNTISPVTKTRKGDGQPTKHILLQKENLVTHDKTWLPARLQPPKLSDGVPYGVYLVEYEQYLHALQYMKGRYLEGRRFDLQRRPTVAPTLLPAVTFSISNSPNQSRARPLVFGTTEVDPLLIGRLNASGFRAPEPVAIRGQQGAYTLRVPLTTEQAAEFSSVPITPPQPPAKNKPTEKQVADRKVAKKARRKARVAARKLEKSTKTAEALTAKVTAEAQLVSAKTKLGVAKRRAKRSKTAPSVLRRRERRAATRSAGATAGVT